MPRGGDRVVTIAQFYRLCNRSAKILDKSTPAVGLKAISTRPKHLTTLSNSRIAFPLDVCQLACRDVNFERAKATDGFPPFERHFVMSRWQ